MNVREILALVDPGTKSRHQNSEISRKKLVNKLNFINFQDGNIQIIFKHTKYDRTISLDAAPLPCLGNQLECLWSNTKERHQKLGSYKFESIFVADDHKLLVVQPKLTDISESGISFLLPETCSEVSYRRTRRHVCEDVHVQFFQNSVLFKGALLDFSPVSFRIELETAPPQTFQWINPDLPAAIVISSANETLFSGECRIIKQSFGLRSRSFVLEPVIRQIRRFRPKEFRSSRHKLVPLPNIHFRHPFSGKITDLKVIDLSGSGFSVEELGENSVLLPGLIIPELELNFANSFSVQCRAQVIYRQEHTDESGHNSIKCGLTFLNMDIDDHVKLLALLHQAKNKHSYLCKKVDLSELWNFFFETGFIYPEKYASIQGYKEAFRKTYEVLYSMNPGIARHFIYQDKGAIRAHMAMLRFYENTWLIQHHAASKQESTRAGVSVLNQLNSSIIDSHSLYSVHMDYVICYFRPDNKFPNRVFGGFARYLNNPKGCSLDSFAYLRHQKTDEKACFASSGAWELVKAQHEDLQDFESYYEDVSGGLMISALDLGPDMSECDLLGKEFGRLGFKREKHLFALKNDGALKAILLVNISDVGLNMSDLTTSINIFMVEPDEVSRTTLSATLSTLSDMFEQQDVPVLLYPASYADQNEIAYEKIYTLFAISTQYSDPYFRFLKSLFRGIDI